MPVKTELTAVELLAVAQLVKANPLLQEYCELAVLSLQKQALNMAYDIGSSLEHNDSNFAINITMLQGQEFAYNHIMQLGDILNEVQEEQ